MQLKVLIFPLIERVFSRLLRSGLLQSPLMKPFGKAVTVLIKYSSG